MKARLIYPIFMLCTLLLTVLAQAQVKPVVRYVKPVATGDGSGTSWTNASANLQAMIDLPGVTQVWVAEGIYYPLTDASGNQSPNDPRTRTFMLKNGVSIYGGFKGIASETSLADRPSVNPLTGKPSGSILSGDLDRDNTERNNSYHVFYHPRGLNLTERAVLDGFVITAGNANGAGGGMYNIASSPTLKNCVFLNNAAPDGQGGAMFNQFGSSPVLTTCLFDNNTARVGGALVNDIESSPVLTNCLLAGNSARTGGAIANGLASNPRLVNCFLLENKALFQAGAIYNSASHPILTNCTLRNNTAELYGGALVNLSNSNPQLTNCLFQSNKATEVGGAVYSIGGSLPTINNCTFEGNAAPDPATSAVAMPGFRKAPVLLTLIP